MHGKRSDLVEALTAASNAPGRQPCARRRWSSPASSIRGSTPSPIWRCSTRWATRRAAASATRRRRRRHVGRAHACKALNEYLFEELGFVGNRKQYEDPRNSCLNEVLERRTGIPITLSVVYMEVARRAGLHIDGVNFPGHFLVRCSEGKPRKGADLIIDPFHAGALLVRARLPHAAAAARRREVAFSKSLLAPATRHADRSRGCC